MTLPPVVSCFRAQNSTLDGPVPIYLVDPDTLVIAAANGHLPDACTATLNQDPETWQPVRGGTP